MSRRALTIEAWARSLLLEFAVAWDGDEMAEAAADRVVAEWMRDYPPPSEAQHA